MNQPFHVFTLGRIPIFAQATFFLLLALSFGGSGSAAEAFAWAFALSFGVLVHELGHALVAQAFGLQPAILLHGWGGLCAHAEAKRDRDDALIIAAGPAVQFALGLVALAAWIGLGAAAPDFLEHRPVLDLLLRELAGFNLFWSLFNLVPLYPLDGGQLFRLLVHKLLAERTADRVTHGAGLLLGAAVAVLAVLSGQGILALMALLLGLENLDVLRGRKSGPRVRRRNRHADGLVREARQALAAGDAREALRLAHQIRAERNLPDDVVGDAWEILVLGSLAAGAPEDALRYTRYAPDTAAVRAARARAEAELKRAAG